MLNSAAPRPLSEPETAGIEPIDAPEAKPAVPLFRPGETCWRIEQASRATVLVDAADYFSALNVALEGARHSVIILGWDFNHRIKLRPGGKEVKNISRYLNRLVRRTRGLRINVLKWNTPLLFEIKRRTIPFFWLNWITHPRLKFRLDSDHPTTACQHQKIVVIDDSVAFCGGIDLTDGRWDCPDHKAQDPRRLSPEGACYTPVHDMMIMVEGPVARALGDLARTRWKNATGRTLRPPPPTMAPWPPMVKPDFRDVDVAIARTEPEWNGRDEVREIEALNLAALASAKSFVYIENQHFASRVIYEAVRKLLDQPDGPEILVVNPDKCPGWVEEMVMGEARNQILGQLQHLPGWHRFRIFAPYGDNGDPVYVHSKFLVVDDHYLRVGSSNFNNRSMGFDKECDLAIAATGADDQERRQTIAAVRNKLIAEHLGVPIEQLIEEAAARGSWIQAIESLRRADGRSLRPIAIPAVPPSDGPVADSLLDPEHPDRLPL